MICSNGKIKCDHCGRYVAKDNHTVDFTPDSALSVEKVLDYHNLCWCAVALTELVKNIDKHVPSDAVFEDIEKEVEVMHDKSNKLHKSLKMSHETFTRKFDI